MKRFYAAKYYDLNDPMEGIFNCDEGTKKEYINDIKKGKQKLRICAFSKDPQNPLLWAHYADGFKGICIKVEIDEKFQDFEIVKVEYSDKRICFNNNVARLRGEFPKLILRQKAKEWTVEKEVRLLSSNEYIQDGIKIKGIFLGLRTPEILKNTIIKLAAPNVEIWNTKIDSKTNKIVIGERFYSKK